MTTQHDNSYKLLFSHPQMVKDLLIGFRDRGQSNNSFFQVAGFAGFAGQTKNPPASGFLVV